MENLLLNLLGGFVFLCMLLALLIWTINIVLTSVVQATDRDSLTQRTKNAVMEWFSDLMENFGNTETQSPTTPRPQQPDKGSHRQRRKPGVKPPQPNIEAEQENTLLREECVPQNPPTPEEIMAELVSEQILIQDLSYGRITGADAEPILEQARENSETMRRHRTSLLKGFYAWNAKRKLTLKIHEVQAEQILRESPWLRKQDDPLYQSKEDHQREQRQIRQAEIERQNLEKREHERVKLAEEKRKHDAEAKQKRDAEAKRRAERTPEQVRAEAFKRESERNQAEMKRRRLIEEEKRRRRG